MRTANEIRCGFGWTTALVWLAAGLTGIGGLPLATAAPKTDEIRDIGSRRELMIDNFLVDRLVGAARLRLHNPVRREIAIVHDAPWEGNGCNYYTVFFDKGYRGTGRYRMYYHAWHIPSDGNQSHPLRIAYAESMDGIHWVKPKLGFFEHAGSKQNNIVLSEINGQQPHDFSVFKDDNPSVKPEAKYKAIGYGNKPPGLYAFQSPDGLRWTPMNNSKPVMTGHAFDTQNIAFWDSRIGKYRSFVRDFDGKIRGIRTATSEDLVNWTRRDWLEYPGTPVEQLYTNQILPYYRAPHLLIGFPVRYVDRGWVPGTRRLPSLKLREQRSRSNKRYGSAVTDTVLMTSRDGRSFHRWNQAFLRPGLRTRHNWAYGDNYMAWQMVETDSPEDDSPRELSMYATESYFTGKTSRLRRYSLRIDGFASLFAPREGGELITRPFRFRGDRLSVNVATSAAGSVRVEILDAAGKPIPGFALAESHEIFGDAVDYPVEWKSTSSVARLVGKPIRLRFVLREADLYALKFSAKDKSSAPEKTQVSKSVQDRCLKVLEDGLRGEDFWPAIHAAEGLTLGGRQQVVIDFLRPKLDDENDSQKRCGLARELVRAGARKYVDEMVRILGAKDSHGHVHAAESLYKVHGCGDGRDLERAWKTSDNMILRLMAAAALTRSGRGDALDFVRKQLVNPDDKISRIAAWIVARVGDRTDVSRLKRGIKPIKDPLSRCYFEHGLALLGDASGRRVLMKNLASDRPDIRTYAAVFAGEARMVEAISLLVGLLDDSFPDVRYRSAQALLELSRPQPASRFLLRRTQVDGENGPTVAVGVENAHLVHTTQLLPGSRADSAEEQIRSVLDQLDALMSGYRTPRSQLVKLNVYVTGRLVRQVVEKSLESWLPTGCWPAVAYVQTPLADPRARVAIDAVFPAQQVHATDGVKHTPSVQKGRASRFARSSVLPRGDVVYVSGQARPGSLSVATTATMRGLFATLEFMKVRKQDIVQIKCFANPVKDAATVMDAIASVFAGETIPPVSLVEWQHGSLPIEIEVVAWRPGVRSKEPLSFATPPGLSSSPVFSRVATIHSQNRIYVAGLHSTGQQSDASQVKSVFDQLKSGLLPHRSDLRHLAKATYYVTTPGSSGELNRLRPSLYDPRRPPAASKAMVSGVGFKGQTISVDMIATGLASP
ncbi:MAG: hypothetical protein MK004_14780 [Planctomycetales bacterium]|nr:hypothetical protein [Planctomycetales bacterium]